MRLTISIRQDIAATVSDDVYTIDEKERLKAELGRALRESLDIKEGWEEYQEYMNVASSFSVYFPRNAHIRCSCDPFPGTFNNWLEEKHIPKSVKVHYDTLKRFLDKKDAFYQKTIKMLKACRTTKQVVELLPEMERYLPDKPTNTELVSVDLITDIQRLLPKKEEGVKK